MLRKKCWRDILKNKAQFLTILIMVTIGVMVYAGIEAYMDGMTAGRKYIESLGIKYTPDSLYTNKDLKENKTIKNVTVVQNKSELKDAISSMLFMMKQMIMIIIVFAVLLGIVIIYNKTILSFGEKVLIVRN